VLHGERVALRVIERNGDQQENSQEGNYHNSVPQQFALMSFRSARLSHQGTFNGLTQIRVIEICSHWNVHRGPFFRTTHIDGSNTGEVVGSRREGSPEVTEAAVAA
jgi:hypothetical protein